MRFFNKNLVFFSCLLLAPLLYKHDTNSLLWLFLPIGLACSVFMRDEVVRSETVETFQQQGGYIINHNSAADGYANKSRPEK